MSEPERPGQEPAVDPAPPSPEGRSQGHEPEAASHADHQHADHQHEGHQHEGHSHSHDGHSHEGHGHEGHGHEGHGHEGHGHEGHSHDGDDEHDADEQRPRRHLPGSGLIAGLATTARTMLRPARTREYPDVKPPLPPRSRGVIALLAENCTSCMLCARECPDWCIYIESHKETVPATEPGGRDKQQNVLDRFAIDFSLCMYCGICIEACPFDALFWSPEFEYAEFDIRNLLHESDRLSGWMESVPAPQLPDHRSAPPKELETARVAAEKAIAEQHETAQQTIAEKAIAEQGQDG